MTAIKQGAARIPAGPIAGGSMTVTITGFGAVRILDVSRSAPAGETV
jgi:hypothetical protein